MPHTQSSVTDVNKRVSLSILRVPSIAVSQTPLRVS